MLYQWKCGNPAVEPETAFEVPRNSFVSYLRSNNKFQIVFAQKRNGQKVAVCVVNKSFKVQFFWFAEEKQCDQKFQKNVNNTTHGNNALNITNNTQK
jgi:hypothetical protein